MDYNTLYDIVMKLVGEVDPTGSHKEDAIRIENLYTLIDLTDLLLMKIDRLSLHRHSDGLSGGAIGDVAYKYTQDVYQGYKECFEREEED